MALIDLPTAKSYLDLSADNTDEDAEITGWIGAVVEVVENVVGPCDPREYTARVRGGGGSWWLPRYPVVELVSVVGVGNTTDIDVDDLDVDGATGRVEYLDGRCFGPGRWTVTYEAGRAEIPGNITRAALMILKHLWTNQRGAAAGRTRFSADTDQPVGFPWAVPKAAMDLLGPHAHGPYVA